MDEARIFGDEDIGPIEGRDGREEKTKIAKTRVGERRRGKGLSVDNIRS